MKIYIEYEFIDGPYGGANQFLKNLRDYLIRVDSYADNPEEADCILINHTRISKATLKVKQEHPEKLFMHRMDGPVSEHRPRARILDWHSFLLDRMLCAGSVFQSQWTRENCLRLGYVQTGDYAVIHNAPNPDIFYRRERQIKEQGDKIRLISTSWSPNINKGFRYIQYLDEHLDFDKYEYVFVGKSPFEFKNIKMYPPMDSMALAEELGKHDIYIAASRAESCSNALIEAMNCGLVPVALRSGCYPEIVKNDALIFDSNEEIIGRIDEAARYLEEYRARNPYYNIEEIGGQYLDFARQLLEDTQSGKICQKKWTGGKQIKWDLSVLLIRVYEKCNRIYEKCLQSGKQ